MGVDGKALWSLSYGMYVVTARADGRSNGQIANTAFQVTAQPPRVAVAINKENLTHRLIRDGGWFGVSVLDDGASMELIGLFGFKSGRDIDKLAGSSFREGQHCPLITDHAVAITEARVVGELDAGTHTIFVGDVVFAEMLTDAPPLTYAAYHGRKGRAPRNAPTYQPEQGPEPTGRRAGAARPWACGVCGFIYDPARGDSSQGVPPGTAWEDLAGDWACPICGASRDEFRPV